MSRQVCAHCRATLWFGMERLSEAKKDHIRKTHVCLPSMESKLDFEQEVR